MFRRKTRNSTAYTGVGHSSPAAQQPNNNAMAAALTIGQNLKQTQPKVYGKPQATATRSPPPKQPHTASLLKRNSSYQGSIAATSTPRQSRANSNLSRRHSMSQQPAVQEYHIDDSFTDASFDQMGIDADNHYNNAARVSDLKLQHVPPKTQSPKMVKKYIPTPNGIKIIEVPAESMKNDIARSNSMRSGMSLGRSGSFQAGPRANSLSTPKRQVRKPSSRLSSIASQPRIDENVAFNPHPHSVDSPQNHADDLQYQIEHEKQLAKDLEDQREKVLKLKELRLKNDRKMRELQILQEEEASHSEESRATSSRVASVDQEPSKDTFVSKPEEPSPVKPLGAAVVADDDDDEEDVPVAPVPFVVDEMESKQLNKARKSSVISSDLAESEVISHSSSRDSFNKVSITTSPHDAVINSYGDTVIPFEESTNATSSEKLGDFGIEEIPKEYFDTPELAPSSGELQIPKVDTLAPPESDSHIHDAPSPTFDPVPEIIGELVPPVNIAGSIRSFSSTDSKSRPIKSAMKNSKSKFNSPSNAPESPANKAYLSLTTAENTRLNSKLSSSQLQEFDAQQELKAQNSRSQLSSHSPNSQIQTLRKQPSGNAQGGLSGRSLRPQSMAESPATRNAHGGGMSSRSFKTQSTIQPLPAHNFHQSSSKLKAAELYAKANSRPTSEFQPLQRKSSFTREGSENQTSAAPTRRTHRTTLRSPQPQSSHAVNANGAREGIGHDFKSGDSRYPSASAPAPKPRETAMESRIHSQSTGGFKSRYADSDDEPSVPQNTGFRSRFNDSDDEGSEVHAPAATPIIEAPQNRTMRSSKPSNDKKEKTEKKPKKKFLKKLFGKD